MYGPQVTSFKNRMKIFNSLMVASCRRSRIIIDEMKRSVDEEVTTVNDLFCDVANASQSFVKQSNQAVVKSLEQPKKPSEKKRARGPPF